MPKVERIVSLKAKDSPDITLHGVLVGDNGLQWIIDETYEDSYKIKYPPGQRLLHMSKNAWVMYAYVDRETV